MNIKQTKAFALSLAVATPTLMQSVPVSATVASADLTPVTSDELIYNPNMDESHTELLGALTNMSADEKQAVGGARITLAGNFAVKSKGKLKRGCFTKGVLFGGDYSNGCPCKIIHGATRPAN